MKQKWTAAVCGAAMALLILDSAAAIDGMRDGVQVCLETVIPALFPFLVVSVMLNAALSDLPVTALRPLGKLLNVPEKALPLLLMGILGGYPVGAQVTALACREGRLHRRDGERMLAFCSNAGPSFLFGMGSRLLGSAGLCFAVWGIHIFASWCVALLTPCDGPHSAGNNTERVVTLPQALRTALGIMANICGWVVLFRVVLNLLQRWCFRALPTAAVCLLSGFLELANGCCMLPDIAPLGLRLAAFACMVGFGGLCVCMQTRSVCDGLDMALYFPGKCCQAAISILLSIPAQLLLPQAQRWFPGIPLTVCCCTACGLYHILCRKMKKKSSSISVPAMV